MLFLGWITQVCILCVFRPQCYRFTLDFLHLILQINLNAGVTYPYKASVVSFFSQVSRPFL